MGTPNMLVDQMDKSIIKSVEDLYGKLSKNSEFEFMFFNYNGSILNYEKYLLLLEYISKKSKIAKLKIEHMETLDINYNPEKGDTSYRITITGVDNINKYSQMLHLRRNHVIFRTLVSMVSEDKATNIELMKKVKDRENVVDIDNWNIRVRLAEETELTKKEMETLQKIENQEQEFISFRYKQRASLFIEESKEHTIRIDLTETRTSKTLQIIEKIVPRYELEVELITEKPKKEYLTTMLKQSEIIYKVIQRSNFIVGKDLSNEVIELYKAKFNVPEQRAVQLEGRKPESLEIQHVTETLPNKYAVTDKADGERNFLMIHKKKCYLVNQNLYVRDIGIEIKKDKYDGSIFDGEYIFLPKFNRHLFMVFDCMYIGSLDVRMVKEIQTRLTYADEIIKECFVLGKQKGFEVKEPNLKTEFNLDTIVKFHEKEIFEYMQALNHDINLEKQFTLVRRKYFMPVYGGKPWEIFRYSSILWSKFTEDASIQCPYVLDGLIYHPLEQEYVTDNRDPKFKLVEYKWKPPSHNSIDFYITFVKNPETGRVLTVYDNAIDKEDNDYDESESRVKYKPYRICHLHVGSRNKSGVQIPVKFREQEDGYICNIYLENGEARDMEGNIITDNTVVEFYYDNNPKLDQRFRWIPMRTRYDKTEAVQRFKRNYGNFISIAEKVWRSIVNPVLMEDMMELGQGNNEKSGVFSYDNKINDMRKKVGKEVIVATSKENIYYQIITNLAKPMRNFHNWIKSILIYTVCNSKYMLATNVKMKILDYGCGRGGDHMKFYYVGSDIDFYVGIDYDYNGLHSSVDGAISRYEESRKKKPNFPKMYYIHMDGGALLNYEDQLRALGSMSNDNKTLIEKFFSKEEKKRTQFDRINCQFVVHYFFKNEDTFSNFKNNMKNYLKAGGYAVFTTFDALEVIKLLGDKDRHAEYYTDDKGVKRVLWELVKQYDISSLKENIGLGQGIGVHMAWNSVEGDIKTEYLVDPRFFAEELLKDCDMELVDSELFTNLYEMNRGFLTGASKFESVDGTSKFFGNVREFYETNEVNNGCIKYNNLMRYYIFRKKDEVSKTKDKQDVQKGGVYDIYDSNKYFIEEPKLRESSYCYSIYNILKEHKIIPKSLSIDNFYKDLGIKIISDEDINDKYIRTLNDKLVISHEIKNKSQKVLDGLNTFIISKNKHGQSTVVGLGRNSHLSTKSNAVVLFNENGIFKPIYRVETDKTKRGLYNMNDNFIEILGEQAYDTISED